jgi:hypothetical protein
MSGSGILFRCANSLHLRLLIPWNLSVRFTIILASSDNISSDKTLCASAPLSQPLICTGTCLSISLSLAAAQMDFIPSPASSAALLRTSRGARALLIVCLYTRAWWCLFCNNTNAWHMAKTIMHVMQELSKCNHHLNEEWLNLLHGWTYSMAIGST